MHQHLPAGPPWSRRSANAGHSSAVNGLITRSAESDPVMTLRPTPPQQFVNTSSHRCSPPHCYAPQCAGNRLAITDAATTGPPHILQLLLHAVRGDVRATD